MNEKEARENIKEQLEEMKKANECGLATKGEFNRDIEAIETILNLLEKKDKIIDLMAEELYIEINCYANPEEVKQYFEYKVEEGK